MQHNLQINRNGSDPDSLIRDLLNARESLLDFKTAFGDTAPHGRDYQTLTDPSEPDGDNDGFLHDRDEWRRMWKMINELDDWVYSRAIVIQKQKEDL